MHKIWVYISNGKLHPIESKLACKLRPYRTYNPMVGFSKYEFNNKLLSDVTLLRVIPNINITWTQL